MYCASRLSQLSMCISLLLLPSACDEEFASRTRLQGYRVVGVEASPPEATPEDTVLLTAHDYYDGTDSLRYEWSACLYGTVELGRFRCADSTLEFSLGNEPSVMLDMSPDGLDVWVQLASGPDCAGCERIMTRKRVRLREGNASSNHNPVIESFEVRGAVKPGQTVSLHVATDAPETFIAPDTGEPISEELLYTWYTSGGETDPPMTFGDNRHTELRLPEEGATSP